MALTTAQKTALEKKALASASKSDGMRLLLDEGGYEVAEVRDVFGVPYGFVYGVAVRNGNITPGTREPKAEKPKAAKATKPAAKAAPAAKATPARKTATAAAKPAPRAAKAKAAPVGKNGKPLTGAAAAAAARKAAAK